MGILAEKIVDFCLLGDIEHFLFVCLSVLSIYNEIEKDYNSVVIDFKEERIS